jgi:hypothetical protein
MSPTIYLPPLEINISFRRYFNDKDDHSLYLTDFYLAELKLQECFKS